MAFLVLASTISWTVDKHYCMGHLVDVAFFTDAESCGMDMGDVSEEWKIDCCSDELIVIQGQDDLKIAFEELSFDQQLFLSSFVMVYLDLYKGLPQQIVPHKDYSPPLITVDLQLLDQIFLI